MPQKLANNARALLTGSINAVATSMTVEAAKSDSFPVLNTGANPVNTPGMDWCKVTAEDASGNIEIMYARTRTSGSGVISNLIRGQEGTTARSFTAGSVVELRMTQLDLSNAIQAAADLAAYQAANPVASQTPIGGVIMFSGTSIELAALAPNWKLCDGTGGTPNLTDKFIVGAGLNYNVNDSGGNKDAIVVAHTHAATLTGTSGGESNTHTHAVTDPGHLHAMNADGKAVPKRFGSDAFDAHSITASADDFTYTGDQNTGSSTTGIALGANSAGHNHSLSVTGTTGSAGSSATNANLPPYYALAFIRRMI